MNDARDIIRDGARRGARVDHRRCRQGERSPSSLCADADHRQRPVRRHPWPDQHAHPHHRRAADAWLRSRRHTVRRERLRVAVPAVLGVRRGRGAHVRSTGGGRDDAVGHHHVPRGGHDPLPRRGHRRAGRGGHPRPRRSLGVGPAARAVGVPPEHRRRDRPPRAPAATRIARMPTGASPRGARSSATRRAAIRCGAPRRRWPTSIDVGHVVPHVAGAARSRRLHRRVRPTADDPPRRDRRARRERRDDARVRIDDAELDAIAAVGRQRRPLPDDRAEGRATA